jgi:uncharacterized protein (DUF488 family)
VFYRRKIILALLQLFDGQLGKIRLQKLLFLFSSRQTESAYHFIPYKLGCYSFSAHADMSAMVKKGILAEDEKNVIKTEPTDYLNQLKPADLKLLKEIKTQYGKMSADALMKHTYIHFPFYAILSEVAENILNKEELEKITRAKPKSHNTVLYTIGYEGISIEEYLVRLLKNDIKVLVDVRNNPLSMKFGFSKSELKKYCNSVGIEYEHIPEVGIQGEQRRELNTQSDYDKLFADYRKNKIPQTITQQQHILNLLKQHHRIALTCFEADIYRCHRKYLAEAIAHLPGFEYEIKHI